MGLYFKINKSKIMSNKFKNGIPTKQHQNYEAMSKTIGRDAKPFKRLNPPVFEEDLRSSWNSEVPFMYTINRPEKRAF